MDALSLLWLLPALPLAAFLLLLASAGRMPVVPAAVIAVGGVALPALLTIPLGLALLDPAAESAVHLQVLWTWIDLDSFRSAIGLQLDGLSLVMVGVVTGVGLLIQLYATGYMREDPDYARFFACMSLFLFSMLVLVLADNLLLLYLGWEGVGLCSYLLIGFHHADPANVRAARKAFVVTRVGDTALAIGLFLLFRELGTLDIDLLLQRAPQHFDVGDPVCTVAALLILGGAVGKSAQLPLQTWLPDAMAGPTPVSALIHAATMVTAGVYLIARLGELFLLAPLALAAVAAVGLATLLLAAFSALTQTDIKRILAYSTMSQIGYMFLALGVGAFSAAIFHLVTHAFFKALLFLSAGSVILALHHEQDISRMGGLLRRLPLPMAGLVIGAAALSALPLTSGFQSKDAILLAASEAPRAGLLLWGGGALAALLTALYSTRLVCLVCLGPPRGDPADHSPWNMKTPLLLLAVLALGGGALPLTPLAAVLPDGGLSPVDHATPVALVTLAIPLLGVALGGWIWGRGHARPDPAAGEGRLLRFWRSGWGFDGLYRMLFERPLQGLADRLRGEPVDLPFRGIALAARWLHGRLLGTQTGALRFYALNMGLGTVLLVLTVLVLW